MGELTQDDVGQLVAGKLDEIERRIEDLSRMRAALLGLAERGATSGPCPVVAALADAVPARG